MNKLGNIQIVCEFCGNAPGLDDACLARIKDLIREAIIGPMERYEEAPTNRDRATRNELREKQLKALEEL